MAQEAAQQLDWVPLIQTVLWIVFLLLTMIYFRKEVNLIREVLAQRLKDGSSFELGPMKLGRELRKEMDSIREDIDEVNRKISNLFLLTMSPTMYHNLKKLSSGEFGVYVKSKGLKRELYHLKSIGYVEVESITKIPEEGDDLSRHVHVTKAGREFVTLRESVLGAEDGV